MQLLKRLSVYAFTVILLSATLISRSSGEDAATPKPEADQQDLRAFLDCTQLYTAADLRDFEAEEKTKLDICIAKYGNDLLKKGSALASMPPHDQMDIFKDSIFERLQMNSHGTVNG
jgi:hypothetical protein